MLRRIKNIPKSFREYNIRKRGLGLPEVSLEEYLAIKLPVDNLGRINPKIKAGENHMLEVFGEYIFTERKTCIKCNHTKPLADFIFRYKNKKIGNICKLCERKRHQVKIKKNLSNNTKF